MNTQPFLPTAEALRAEALCAEALYPAPGFELLTSPPAFVTTEPVEGVEVALVADVRHSILEFDPGEWDRVVPTDEPQLRYQFLRAVEVSGMGAGPTYVAVRQGGAVVGIAVAYQSDVDLLTLASPRLHRFASAIRKGPLKRFLVIKALSCGPVITNCRPNLFLVPDLTPGAARQAAALLIRHLDEVRGGNLKVMFEYNQAAVEAFGPVLEDRGYVQIDSLPGTRINVQWDSFDSYLGAMRKLYRRAVRSDQEAGAGLEIKVESNFSALATEAHALYQNVLERANTVMERLTPEFFAELGQFEQARLVTAREKSSGKLVGIELLMVGETTVQDLYTGVDYDFNDKYNIYFNLVYPGIALACREGKQSISTGQTSYVFKSRLGVQPYDLHFFVRHSNPLIHAILCRLKNVLCPTVKAPTHRVFRGETGVPSLEMSSLEISALETPKSQDYNAAVMVAS